VAIDDAGNDTAVEHMGPAGGVKVLGFPITNGFFIIPEAFDVQPVRVLITAHPAHIALAIWFVLKCFSIHHCFLSSVGPLQLIQPSSSGRFSVKPIKAFISLSVYMIRLNSVRVPPSMRHFFSSSIKYIAVTPDTPIIPMSINEVFLLIFPVSRIAAMA
jgi:hypothetical protein